MEEKKPNYIKGVHIVTVCKKCNDPVELLISRKQLKILLRKTSGKQGQKILVTQEQQKALEGVNE
jgi:hypothetical protein